MTTPLELTEAGILPAEMFDVDLDAVEALFGQFQTTSHRRVLFRKLAEYVDALRAADIGEELIVDGSFVMGCIDEPDDIDVVLVLSETWDLAAGLKPFQYNLVSKRDVKRNYPIEVFPVIRGSDAETQWTAYFHQINTKWYEPFGFAAGSRKGLLRIEL